MSAEMVVLLVDDQEFFSHALKRALRDQQGVSFHYCSCASQALEVIHKVQPTVILQDLVMPEMDGMALLREYRIDSFAKKIPKIVLSTKEESSVKQQAFSLGADDYLVKFPDEVELVARLRYHSNNYIHLLERDEAYEKLSMSKQRLLSELREAAQYVQAALPPPIEGDLCADWVFIPSEHLGGDSFGYYWLDEDHFAFYLIDVCGHGVPAALFSISVMNVLRAHSLPQTDFYDPKSVLEALNKHFPMEEHKEKFFTMWYGVFSKKSKSLLYSSAGHPPALLFSQEGRELLKTQGPAIGVSEEIAYVNGKKVIEEPFHLYLLSDGVFELLKSDGQFLEFDDFVEDLTQLVKEGKGEVRQILDYAHQVNQGKLFADDFSLLRIFQS